MDDESEIGRYLKKQSKSNPLLMVPTHDSALLERLQRFGLVQGHALLLSKFELLGKKGLVVTGKDSLPVHVGLKKHDSMFDQTLFFAKGKDTLPLKLSLSEDVYVRVMKDSLANSKTIVIANTYYVMNGHNFDMFVYETGDN